MVLGGGGWDTIQECLMIGAGMRFWPVLKRHFVTTGDVWGGLHNKRYSEIVNRIVVERRGLDRFKSIFYNKLSRCRSEPIDALREILAVLGTMRGGDWESMFCHGMILKSFIIKKIIISYWYKGNLTLALEEDREMSFSPKESLMLERHVLPIQRA